MVGAVVSRRRAAHDGEPVALDDAAGAGGRERDGAGGPNRVGQFVRAIDAELRRLNQRERALHQVGVAAVCGQRGRDEEIGARRGGFEFRQQIQEIRVAVPFFRDHIGVEIAFAARRVVAVRVGLDVSGQRGHTILSVARPKLQHIAGKASALGEERVAHGGKLDRALRHECAARARSQDQRLA